ncbi:MAG: hypothetical protein V3S64_13630 [bacterium]
MSYDAGQTPPYGEIRDPGLDEGDFVFPLNASGSAPVTANVPKGPGKSKFSLDDIAGEAKQQKANRRAWTAKLVEMKGAYSQVQGYDRDNTTPNPKATAWQRFLSAFAENNPYTTEDDDLRSQAQSRITHWRSEPQRLVRLEVNPRRSDAEARRQAETRRRQREAEDRRLAKDRRKREDFDPDQLAKKASGVFG